MDSAAVDEGQFRHWVLQVTISIKAKQKTLPKTAGELPPRLQEIIRVTPMEITIANQYQMAHTTTGYRTTEMRVCVFHHRETLCTEN